MKLRIQPVVCVDVSTGVDRDQMERDLQRAIEVWAKVRGFTLVDSKPSIRPIPVLRIQEQIPVVAYSGKRVDFVKGCFDRLRAKFKGLPSTKQNLEAADVAVRALIKQLAYDRIIKDQPHGVSMSLDPATKSLTFSIYPDIVVYEDEERF